MKEKLLKFLRNHKLAILIVTAIFYYTAVILFGFIVNQLINGISNLYVLVIEIFSFALMLALGTIGLIAYVLFDTITRYRYIIKNILSSLKKDEKFIYRILMIKQKVTIEYLIKLFGNKSRVLKALKSLKEKGLIKIYKKGNKYYVSLYRF